MVTRRLLSANMVEGEEVVIGRGRSTRKRHRHSAPSTHGPGSSRSQCLLSLSWPQIPAYPDVNFRE